MIRRDDVPGSPFSACLLQGIFVSLGVVLPIEFVDLRGDDFAYVGTRTTGTQAGNYLISGPGWHGTIPNGVTQITSPDNTVALIGRVLVQNATDVSTAYGLSKLITLTPLSNWLTTAT